jgi:hypothetical protein
MSIIDTVKEVAKVARQINNIELSRQIVLLQTEVLELHDENHRLRREVAALTERMQLRERLVFERNFYWIVDDGERDGPYCPRCYDKEREPRRMLAMREGRSFGCPTCILVLKQDGATIEDQAMIARLQRALLQVKVR